MNADGLIGIAEQCAGYKTPIKFIVIGPDDNRPIELEFVQTLDGGDGSIILQLKAKDDLPIPSP